ncbi:MAG: BrnT family toxin, partial [candidate division NC10 bacterium]|nr:BrnT family toxin [candidate division NC10 bacterium]
MIEKLAWKHHLSTDEVEEALAGRTRFRRMSRGHLKGEDLYVAYGQTEAGRYLTLFFIAKKSGNALVVS